MLAGVVLGLGASACWAIANVAVQRSTRHVGAFRALFWSLLVGVAIAAAAVPFVDVRKSAFAAMDLLWLLGAGSAGLFAYVCMFHAFEHGKLTVAVPVISSWAVLSAGLSLLLFDDRVRPLQLVGAAAVIAGAVVVSRYAQAEARAATAGPAASRWLAASVGAAVGFGLTVPLMGRLAAAAGSLGSICLVYAFDVVAWIPLARWRGISLAPPPRQAWPIILAAALFETAGYACITLGARYAPLALVSPLSSLASAFTVAFAWAVLRERPANQTLVGAALVCAGVLILAL